MKKSYSPSWRGSAQPRKQRKFRANAPLHVRQKMVAAHLAKELRKSYGKRAVPLRKGDEVIILTGAHKGMRSKVARIDLSRLTVELENLKAKKRSGQEVAVRIEPSNLLIVQPDLSDKRRFKRLKNAPAAKTKTETKKETQASAPMETKPSAKTSDSAPSHGTGDSQ